MPLNFSNGSTSNISFGPAVVFLGASGTTPTTGVGFIGNDDGVSLEMTSDKRDITQGNPKLVEYTFTQVQGVMAKFKSIEWDFTRLAWAFGAGVTTVSGSEKTLAWGGDPLVTTLAMHIQHQRPVTGTTLNFYVWKCVAETPPNIMLGHDEHSFDMAFKAQRAATGWDGGTLLYNQQLIKVVEIL